MLTLITKIIPICTNVPQVNTDLLTVLSHIFNSFFLTFSISLILFSKGPSIILPVVLYGCETWSLTLQEERKLKVFENMVLRRIFGARKDEVTGEWRIIA